MTTPATFIGEFFEHSTGSIHVCSLPNERDGRRPAEIYGRGGADRLDTLVMQTWDKKDRGTFFCVNTIAPGQQRRSKETIHEITCLHVDVDFSGIDTKAMGVCEAYGDARCTDVCRDPKDCSARPILGVVLPLLQALEYPPSKIVSSGHGLHAYWLLSEALAATPEIIQRVETALRGVATMLGGDPAVAEIARLMRMPGSHNTKNGERLLVKIISDTTRRYELGDLCQWIEDTRPLIARKGGAAPASNPFLAVDIPGVGGPAVDIEARLAGMTYQGVGNASIHSTQISVTAALLSRGVPVDEVVARVLDATRLAAGAAGDKWNWTAEEKTIRGMCASWSRKKLNGSGEPADMPLPFINVAAWDNEPVPDQAWSVPDRFPLRQAVLFSGEGAAGKSTIYLHLCAAHVLGKEWLGSLPEPGPALFVEAEDGADVMHRRLVAVARHFGATFGELACGGLHLLSYAGQDAVIAAATRTGKIEPTPLFDQLLEAAGDLKPKMIGLASSANIYAGSEIDRSQVQQFMSLLTRLAMAADGTCHLISHPSLTGINSDSGVSGSTQWHNAVRARCYLKSTKSEADEQPDNDLRELVFKKNNYGPVSETIALRYRDGLFLPLAGTSFDAAVQEAKADEVFIDLLKRLYLENRPVSHKLGPTYAPAVFAKEDEARRANLNNKSLEAAMRRLFHAGKIWNEPYGKPSRLHYRFAVKS